MMTMAVVCRAAALALTSALYAASVANGGEIRVMTSGAFTAAYLELKPRYESATQNNIVTLATTMGIGQDFIPNRLQRGEPVDVVIVDDASLDKLIGDGRVSARSKVPLAKSSIGMAVRAGAPKPDISSVEALKRTLLQAKSIAYSASVSGDYLSTELFPRLGIVAQLASKSRTVERERVGAVVARGEAEIGFQQISELLPIQGIDYVGPLPSDLQRVTVFSAGVVVGAKNFDAANAFIRFLASPEAVPTIAKSGLEPIAASSATGKAVVAKHSRQAVALGFQIHETTFMH
jgi:molybdate transport system substrate-binding protein